eukprot:364254-Chlamydomonas_euryale.AAC.9
MHDLSHPSPARCLECTPDCDVSCIACLPPNCSGHINFAQLAQTRAIPAWSPITTVLSDHALSLRHDRFAKHTPATCTLVHSQDRWSRCGTEAEGGGAVHIAATTMLPKIYGLEQPLTACPPHTAHACTADPLAVGSSLMPAYKATCQPKIRILPCLSPKIIMWPLPSGVSSMDMVLVSGACGRGACGGGIGAMDMAGHVLGCCMDVIGAAQPFWLVGTACSLGPRHCASVA